MSNVPTNLIPTRTTQLPEYTGTSTLGYLPYVIDGRTYKVQFANIAAVGAVPSSRVIATGDGLQGGGDLSEDRTISIISHGVGFSQLDFTGVVAGTYGGADTIPAVTIDATGRVTSVVDTPVVLGGYVPSSRTVTAGAGLTGGGQLNSNITLALNPSNATPQPLGAASAGIGLLAAREDHVHPAVDLTDTTETQGVLPLGRGGTGDALSPVVGALIFADTGKLSQTVAGNAGQLLTSAGGASQPFWQSLVAGSGISITQGSGTITINAPGGTGTVTSVSGTGTVNGISLTGTVTSSGFLTLGGTLSGVSLTTQVAGTLPVANGGTGQTSYTNGQLLIGNTTGNTLAKATLTAGTNVSITNGAGSITINANDAFVGTVTSVSVVSANGFSGTVANATTTPAITLSTSVTGIVKGNGTALSAASAGTDYVAPGAYTTSGLTMATSRLLGRTTASTGAAEEITVGTGLTLATGSLVNAAPDRVVALTGAGTTSISGTYPNFTITSSDAFVGTVTSVGGTGTVSGLTLTGTVTTSGNLTLGGTLAVVPSNFASQTANTFLAAPNYAPGVPTFRAIVAADVPTLNQNTTGTAANVTGTVAVANGGTGQTTYTNGQLLIGNTTGNTLAKATLTAGTNVSITNGAGSITISATDAFVGTVTSVGFSGGTTGLTATSSTTNPITTSGTFTIGGTLGIANGGTNSTSTATAGGVAYGTGTAIVVNAAGPAGYVLTSGGAAPPVWTPVASLAVGTEAYWGSFWDTTTQTAATANTAYTLTLNTADVENNGVTIVSGSRVTFVHAGVYSLTFSAQLTNTDNSNTAHIVNIWLRKNGADVTATDSKFTVPGKFGSAHGAIIGTVNFVLPLAANDYIELVWSTNDTSVAVTSFPAGTTPVSPVTPGIIFTAVAAAPVGLGYAGVESSTSLTVGTGSKTFTVNTNATDTAFIVGNRVRLVNSSTNYMDGVITAYSGTSMTVLVDGTAGSGTYTAWSVTLTGSVGGVTSFSGNSTGLTPATPTVGAISLAGTLNVANGGTGQTTYTNGQLLIGNTTGNTLAKATLTAGTNVSITNGAGSITINATDAFVGTVTSVSGTGTVNGITLTGTVTSSGSLTLGGTLSGVSLTTQVSGTLPATNGGTGQSSYAVGDLLYASTTTALSKLADVATGNALLSGGVGVAPLYGKIGLTTHVSGTLPVANGGTNATATPTAGAVAYGTGTAYAFTTAGTAGQVLVSTGGTAPAFGGIDGGTF